MNRLNKALAGSITALALVAASAPAHATRIIVITHGQASDTFWSVVKNGVDPMGSWSRYPMPTRSGTRFVPQLRRASP